MVGNFFVNFFELKNVEKFKVKIVDFGNVCWVYKYFIEDI